MISGTSHVAQKMQLCQTNECEKKRQRPDSWCVQSGSQSSGQQLSSQVAVREACVTPYTAFYTHLITIKTQEHLFDLL